MANSMIYTKEYAEINAASIKFTTLIVENVIVLLDLLSSKVLARNALKIISTMNINNNAKQIFALVSINSTAQ
jgi:hypothetical protein